MNHIGKTPPSLDQLVERPSAQTDTARPLQPPSLPPQRDGSAKHVSSQVDGGVATNIKSAPPSQKELVPPPAKQVIVRNDVADQAITTAFVVPPNTAGTATPAATGTSPVATPAAAPTIPPFGVTEHRTFLAKLSGEAKQLVKQYGLTGAEAAAIHAYTRDDYYLGINHQLRSISLDKVDLTDAAALAKAGVKNPEMADLIAAMVRGMKKLPPTQMDDACFISLGRNVTLPQNELQQYQENAEVAMPTFLSTTISQNEMITDRWWDHKEHALFITQRLHGNGRDVSAFSEFPIEKEILFLPNTRFKILFRGAPTETEAGLSSAAISGTKVTKTLIMLQEIPSEQELPVVVQKAMSQARAASAKQLGKGKTEHKATYFGLR